MPGLILGLSVVALGTLAESRPLSSSPSVSLVAIYCTLQSPAGESADDEIADLGFPTIGEGTEAPGCVATTYLSRVLRRLQEQLKADRPVSETHFLILYTPQGPYYLADMTAKLQVSRKQENGPLKVVNTSQDVPRFTGDPDNPRQEDLTIFKVDFDTKDHVLSAIGSHGQIYLVHVADNQVLERADGRRARFIVLRIGPEQFY